MNNVLGRIHKALAEAGIPVYGVSSADDGATVQINFKPEATEAERAQAAQIVATFDRRKRRPVQLASFLTSFNALTNAQKVEIAGAAIWLLMNERPDFAARVKQRYPALGDHDEPEA
jgi:hypothetical protein